jgi:GT2 family glycosyltransferase/glycosyltransferase involved in cell wall biosynthesis
MSGYFTHYALIEQSGLFDERFYLAAHPAAAAARMDPIAHYLEQGAALGLKPNPNFDVDFYLQQCADAGEKTDNPLVHFLTIGAKRGLKTSQDGRAGPRPTAAVEKPQPETAAAATRRPLEFTTIALSATGQLRIEGTCDLEPALEQIAVLFDHFDLGRGDVSTADIDDQTSNRRSFKFAGEVPTPVARHHFVRVWLTQGQGKEQRISLRLKIRTGYIADANNVVEEVRADQDIRLYIEGPTAPADDSPITVIGDLVVAGWAFGQAKLDRIAIRIGEVEIVSSSRFIARMDVQSAFPEHPHALRSGFEILVPEGVLPAGTSSVEICAIDVTGARTSRTIRVAAEPKPVADGGRAATSVYAMQLYEEVTFRLKSALEVARQAAARAGETAADDERPADERVHEIADEIGRAATEIDLIGRVLGAFPPTEAIILTPLHDVLENAMRILGGQSSAAPAAIMEGAEASGLPAVEAAHDPLEDLKQRFRSLAFPTADQPKVSILIPAFNQFFFTYQCLASILEYPPRAPYEVIVVDDGSSDETVHIGGLVSNLIVVRNEVNAGFIESCNRGAEMARGDYLMLLNNDASLTEGAIDALLDTFEAEGVGCVGAKLVYPDGRLQEAGGIIWQDGSITAYGRLGDPAHCDFNYRRSVDYCSGAAIMVPKALWDQLGGFDDRYKPAYYEDTDLALRIRELGYEVLYQPLSTVVHVEGISSGKDIEAGPKANQLRNAEIFRDRWEDRLKTHRPTGEEILLERDRGSTKRALFIDAVTPTPDQDAGSNVTFEHMKVLQSLGYKVTFVPQDNFAFVPKYTFALQRIGIEAIYHPYYSSLAEFLQTRGAEFDLCYVLRFPTGEEVIPLLRKFAPRAQVLFNTVDLHFLRMSRGIKLNPSQSQVDEVQHLRSRELAVIRSADCTLVCNTTELAILEREAPEAKLHYLPWVMELPKPPFPSFSERSGFMFLGGFGHPPNLDAVKFFLRTTMPLIRRLLPDVEFHIYGSKIPDELLATAEPGVIVEGFAEQLDTTFGRHRVSIAPLRYGAGFKGKIATSLGYQVPVVATTIGAEGTGLRHGEHILVADNPVSFAEALALVYTDEAVWREIGAKGYAFAEQEFSAARGRAHLSEILSSIGLGGQQARERRRQPQQ